MPKPEDYRPEPFYDKPVLVKRLREVRAELVDVLARINNEIKKLEREKK